MSLLHRHSPFRIFFISGLVSLVGLGLVFYYLGAQAALITLVLIIIEITFSFENAIINARVLTTLSVFWQRMFMTVGILIAVFGMRVIFPIVIVMLSAGLSWEQVIHLALHQPEQYAQVLHRAHSSIAAFGGMFLLMLTLHFFFDKSREVRWIGSIEQPLQYIGKKWLHSIVCIVVLLVITTLFPLEYPREVLMAGVVGILVYLGIHVASELFTAQHERAEKRAGKTLQKTAWAGLASFIYLEVLDASFSFDGVIGAFAVTKDVILIAAGLGIGALWVRSLTLFVVHRKVLHTYRYLEHGAHYVIGILACTLLIGLFYNIPEALAGVLGVGIITASIISSVRHNRAHNTMKLN